MKLYSVFLSFLIISLIIIYSDITYSQRYWNIAARFEGNQNSFIRVIPSGILQNINGSFTVECWFNADNASGGSLFGHSGIRLLLDSYSGKLRGRIQTNNNTKLYTKTSNLFEPGHWYHIACTYDAGANLMRFYINGILDSSSSGNYNPTGTSEDLFIGTSVYGSYKGLIDDIRIWRRALSPYEIQTNYRNSYVGSIGIHSNFGDALCMSANFDFTYSPGFGLYFYDGFNTFEFQNVLAEDIGIFPSTTTGENYSLDLTNGGYAKVPSNPDIELNKPLTIEAWIYPINSLSGTYQFILRKGNNYGAFINSNGYLDFYISGFVIPSYTLIPSEKWTHIAASYSLNNTISVYINGEMKNFVNFNQQNNLGNDTLYLGSDVSGGSSFYGYLDGIKISNYSKSQDEIKRDMFRIIDYFNKPSPPNITVSYNFDFYNASTTLSGGFYNLRNGAKYSSVFYNIPVSPIIGSNINGFPDGYFIKYSGERIPQSNTAGYMKTDSLEITLNTTISDLKLFISLNHSRLSDLDIYLVSPSDDSVIVWNKNQGNNIGHIITVFDEYADSNLINNIYFDLGPTVKPHNSLLAVFSGKNSQGIWKLAITDFYNGNYGYLYAWGLRINNSITGTDNYYNQFLNEFRLIQNYPNPFNPVTTIQYSIPRRNNVTLKVFDILGNEVATLVNEEKERGVFSVMFEASNLASGIYFYRLQAGNFVETKKMILLR